MPAGSRSRRSVLAPCGFRRCPTTLPVPDVTLRTPRLILEPLLATHAEALYPGLRDPALYTFLPKGRPTSLDELRARFARLEGRASPDGTQRWLNWAARLAPPSLTPEATPPAPLATPYVGQFEATVHPDRTATIAYFVFASAQRTGLGAEGAAAVVAHLFAAGVDTVFAYIDTRNQPSIRLVEKLGFERARFIENADYFRGSASHEHVYRKDGQATSD